MKKLTKEQILGLHDALIEEFGGSHGIRDEGLFEAAIAAPFQEFAGEELFPSIEEKAARLGYGLIKNHAMIDGNKRLGTHAMLVFLELNHIQIDYTQKELYTEILNVASGKSSFEHLVAWIISHKAD